MTNLKIYLAKYLILLPVIVVIYVFWRQSPKRRKEMLLVLLAGGILSLVLARLGGHFYSDPRPVYKDHIQPLVAGSGYNGFPSDHALLASFLAFVLLRYSRAYGTLLLATAVVIAWARVAAGAHHLIDIVGSFIFTAIATGVTILLLKLWRRRDVPPAAD